MTAIVHALHIIGQLFAIMGVVFALPLLVGQCGCHWWRCRCARRQSQGVAAGLASSTSVSAGYSPSASVSSDIGL